MFTTASFLSLYTLETLRYSIINSSLPLPGLGGKLPFKMAGRRPALAPVSKYHQMKMVRVRLAPPPTSRGYWARTSSSSRAKPAKRSGGATGDRAKKRPRQHPAARSSSSKGQSSRSASASSSSSSSSSARPPALPASSSSTRRVHDLTEAKSSRARLPSRSSCAPPQASLQLNRVRKNFHTRQSSSSSSRVQEQYPPPPKPRSFFEPPHSAFVVSSSSSSSSRRGPTNQKQAKSAPRQTAAQLYATHKHAPSMLGKSSSAASSRTGCFSSSVVTSRQQRQLQNEIGSSVRIRLQDKWRPIEIGVEYFMRLTAQQLQASSLSPKDNVIVVAGPGTGKTFMLTSRICAMIAKGVPKFSILTLSFTRQARETIQKRVRQHHPPKPNETECTFNTFHGFAYSVLRRCQDFYPVCGYRRPFGDAHTRVSFVPNNHVHAYVANAILRYNQDKKGREEAGGLPEYDLTDASSGGRIVSTAVKPMPTSLMGAPTCYWARPTPAPTRSRYQWIYAKTYRVTHRKSRI